MAKYIDDPGSVTALIQKLDREFAETVEEMRQIILQADEKIGEQIKWNSPSFYYIGEMKPFDPKEYKRDIVVMNLRKNVVLLVFPTGEKVKDETGLLEGDYVDGRRLATFKDLNDIKNKASNLQAVISKWIELIEK